MYVYYINIYLENNHVYIIVSCMHNIIVYYVIICYVCISFRLSFSLPLFHMRVSTRVCLSTYLCACVYVCCLSIYLSIYLMCVCVSVSTRREWEKKRGREYAYVKLLIIFLTALILLSNTLIFSVCREAIMLCFK